MQNKYMNIAIKESIKAYKKREVPVGCVIVKNDKVIAKSHNLKEKHNKVTSHAELLAINKASKKLKNWRLNDCDIYITLQPCPMCSSAIKQSRIRNIYYILDNKNNEISNEILQKTDINKRIMKMEKINNESYKKTIETFFKKQRNK